MAKEAGAIQVPRGLGGSRYKLIHHATSREQMAIGLPHPKPEPEILLVSEPWRERIWLEKQAPEQIIAKLRKRESDLPRLVPRHRLTGWTGLEIGLDLSPMVGGVSGRNGGYSTLPTSLSCRGICFCHVQRCKTQAHIVLAA